MTDTPPPAPTPETAASQQAPASAEPRKLWVMLLILASVLVTFGPFVRHGFLSWDDDYTITRNPRIQHPSLQNVAYYWRHEFMDLYVPVTYTVWSCVAHVSRALHGGNPEDALTPFAFHAASVAVHAINALLVFALLRRLLKKTWPAVAGAMLFALHPVQVETVAWTSGLKDLLCAMFSLIALNQYVIAADSQDEPASGMSAARRRFHYAAGIIAVILGMLSKPTAMVSPVLAVVIDLLVLRRHWRRVLVSAAPYLLLIVPCLILTKLCQPSGYLRYVPLWQRPLVALDAIAFYLYKIALPIHLTFDYGRSPWVAVEKGWVYLTWIVPVALAGIAFAFRRRLGVLPAAGLLLVIGVAPVLGLSTFDFEMISTVADHYLYLALLGPALAAAWLLCRVPETQRWPKTAACLVLAVLAGRSVEQGRYWQDSRAFFSHALDLNPESWSSWAGLAYLAHIEGQQLAARATAEAASGQNPIPDRMAADDLLHAAMDGYERAVQINPALVSGYHGYGAMLMYFGDYRHAAVAFMEVLARRDGMSPAARQQFYEDTDLLGQCLLYGGNPDAATRVLRDAMKLRPVTPGTEEHLKAAELALAAMRNKADHNTAITDTRREAYQDAIGSD